MTHKKQLPFKFCPSWLLEDCQLISVKIRNGSWSEFGINLSCINPGAMTCWQAMESGRIQNYVALDLLNNVSELQTHHLQHEDINIDLSRPLSRLCKKRTWEQRAEKPTHGKHLVHDNYFKLRGIVLLNSAECKSISTA